MKLLSRFIIVLISVGTLWGLGIIFFRTPPSRVAEAPKKHIDHSQPIAISPKQQTTSKQRGSKPVTEPEKTWKEPSSSPDIETEEEPGTLYLSTMPNGARYVKREAMLTFYPDVTEEEISAYLYDNELELITRFANNSMVHVRFKHSRTLSLINNLSSEEHSIIKYAEPNYVYELAVDLPNDYHSELWWINNQGEVRDGNNEIIPFSQNAQENADVASGQITNAWDIQQGGNAIVAIPDTGVDIYHPDLTQLNQNKLTNDNIIEIVKTRIWQNPDETEDNTSEDANVYVDDVLGWDFANQDNNPAPDLDFMINNGNMFYDWIENNVEEAKQAEYRDNLLRSASHGTHIAGVIAALSNNNQGIHGVALNDVVVMPIKIAGLSIVETEIPDPNDPDKKIKKTDVKYNFTTVTKVIESIEYASLMKAVVVNCSWGGPGQSQALEDTIKNHPEMLFVAAAGNGDKDGNGVNIDTTAFFPAIFQFNHLISIAASDTRDALTTFSNYGKSRVHIAVPGKTIKSLQASVRDEANLVSYNEEKYMNLSGTSMATGIASGIASLIYLKLKEKNDANNQLTPMGEVKFAMVYGARKYAALSNKVSSSGIVDLYQSLLHVEQETLPPYIPETFTNDQPGNDLAVQAAPEKEPSTSSGGGGCGAIDLPPGQGPFGLLFPYLCLIGFLLGHRRLRRRHRLLLGHHLDRLV